MGDEEKDRETIRGAKVVFRVRAALRHNRDAGGSCKRDWKSRDAMVYVLMSVKQFQWM